MFRVLGFGDLVFGDLGSRRWGSGLKNVVMQTGNENSSCSYTVTMKEVRIAPMMKVLEE